MINSFMKSLLKACDKNKIYE